MRVWAMKGAEQRLREIEEEAKAIFATFPELRAEGRGFERATKGKRAANESAQPAAPIRRGRRKMSAAARKRIGDAQRKRWAEKRQQDSTASAPAPAGARKAGRKRGRKAAKASGGAA
jgi:hypothetical protein